MCQNAVRCPWKKFVVIPKDVYIFSGTDCICPSACPNYNSRQAFCCYARFTAKKDSATLTDIGAETYPYTEEEIKKQFPDYIAPAAPAAIKAAPLAVPEVRVEEPMAQEQRTPASYVLPLFGAALSSADKKADYSEESFASQKGTATLKPKKSYEAFELRGVYYTLDGRGGTKNLKDSVIANNLYRMILCRFDIQSVFDGNDFKDNFIWVLDNTLSGERRSKAISVLQMQGLDRVEKLFLLFYGAVFSDSFLPLYWANGFTRELLPVYNDVNDFYRKISERKDGGFFNNYTKFVLLWLKKITLSDLDDNERRETAIRKIQEEVAIDGSSDVIVFWSSNGFVCLGRKAEFVNNLTASDKSLTELEYTAEFLSRFDIVRQGAGYRVVANVGESEEITVGDEEFNDDVMSLLFSQDRSVNKLKKYLYIVKRYCKLFSPRTVEIGGIRFEEGLYTEQIINFVIEMYGCLFDEVSTVEQKLEAHRKAMLSKLLYSKAVLFKDSAMKSRDAGFMEGLLSLVTNCGYDDSSIQPYFAFCKKYGLYDKIVLYSYDYTTGQPKKKILPLREWLSKKITGTATLPDLCALLNTPIFNAYRSVFGLGDNNSEKIEKIFELYKSEEKKIIDEVGKL